MFTDNLGLVSAISNQLAKDRPLMTLIRRVVLLLLCYDIMLVTFHIPGTYDIIADSLL